MKIAYATPLYPPDVAEPAPYGKELARRLSKEHEVRVLTYGFLPESIPGVTVQVVRKQLPAFIRIAAYAYKLLNIARWADALILENGQSVEVPAYVSLSLCRKPVIFHVGDARASARVAEHPLLSFTHRQLRKRYAVINIVPSPRPEVLPFEPYPTEAMRAYELSWETHLRDISTMIHGT